MTIQWTSLLWTPLGLFKVWRCPHFRSSLYGNTVGGTLDSVLIIEVSIFKNVLIREVPLYMYNYDESKVFQTVYDIPYTKLGQSEKEHTRDND